MFFFFIDRNCCSPKGWGTLIVKKIGSLRTWHWLSGPDAQVTNTRERERAYFRSFVVSPEGDGWSRKCRQGWWERMSNVLVRLFKDRGTRHPEEDGIEEIAQAWSLFVSSPSFASLSLPLALQRGSPIFNRASKHRAKEKRKLAPLSEKLDAFLVYYCRATYARARWERFDIVNKKPWTEVNKKSRVLVSNTGKEY